MLSSAGHITLDALKTGYERFCKASESRPIHLGDSTLRSYKIKVWYDAIGGKEMCTGFAKAPFLKSLSECVCLPAVPTPGTVRFAPLRCTAMRHQRFLVLCAPVSYLL